VWINKECSKIFATYIRCRHYRVVSDSNKARKVWQENRSFSIYFHYIILLSLKTCVLLSRMLLYSTKSVGCQYYKQLMYLNYFKTYEDLLSIHLGMYVLEIFYMYLPMSSLLAKRHRCVAHVQFRVKNWTL
jgi:hypothetical protein